MISALVVFGAVAVVDRIEGPVAVLEWHDLTFTEIPVALLPAGAEEGDRIVVRTRPLKRTPHARVSGSRPRGAARARGRASD